MTISLTASALQLARLPFLAECQFPLPRKPSVTVNAAVEKFSFQFYMLLSKRFIFLWLFQRSSTFAPALHLKNVHLAVNPLTLPSHAIWRIKKFRAPPPRRLERGRLNVPGAGDGILRPLPERSLALIVTPGSLSLGTNPWYKPAHHLLSSLIYRSQLQT